MKKNEALFRIVKKNELDKFKIFSIRIYAILVAFIISGILIIVMGNNPIEVFSKMFLGPLKKNTLVQVIEQATSLIICALGIILAFKMRFWNLGGEGQILFGAIGATYFALNYSHWPQYILLPVMLLASFVFGALWGLLPAFFKAKFGTNETLFTLMMNYIALYIVYFLESSVWRNPKELVNKIARFDKSARIPSIFSTRPWSNLNASWILAILLVIFVYIYIRKSKSGYEVSVVGESVNTARYAGMKVSKIIIRTMLISAGFCGITGFIQAAGVNSTLSPTVTGNVGNTAIIIAWLSQLNPFAVFFVSILFSIMNVGGGLIEMIGIPPAASEMIQGIILFCVLGSEFFLNYKVIFNRAKKKPAPDKVENVKEGEPSTNG